MDGQDSRPSKKRRKTGKRCVAYGCSNDAYTEPKVSLHAFPKKESEPMRHKAWVDAVRKTRKGWMGTPEKPSAFQSCVLCSNHFEQKCFEPINELHRQAGFRCSKVQLKKDAIPTNFFLRTHDKELKKSRDTTLLLKLQEARAAESVIKVRISCSILYK